ncbi:MAG: hypothetical protein PUB32_07915 [Clostridiales bacterium]|nr:hypothetical protein [Clostridiales bacterium]
MYGRSFAMGVGIGLAAGALLSVAMMPKKKTLKCGSGKMMKTIGDIIDNISGMIG